MPDSLKNFFSPFFSSFPFDTTVAAVRLDLLLLPGNNAIGRPSVTVKHGQSCRVRHSRDLFLSHYSILPERIIRALVLVHSVVIVII